MKLSFILIYLFSLTTAVPGHSEVFHANTQAHSNRPELESPSPAIQFFDEKGKPTTSFIAGEKVQTILTGLPPHRLATVRAQWNGCEASATFLSNGVGQIDLTQLPALTGTYQGVDAEGLFWSMKCPELKQNGWRTDILFSVEVDNQLLAQQALSHAKNAQGVVVKPVQENGLVGHFFTPPGKGPFPTVITLGGSEGGDWAAYENAAYLASRGFACLSLAYFKTDGLPQELKNIPLEYFGKAKAHPPDLQ